MKSTVESEEGVAAWGGGGVSGADGSDGTVQ